MQWLWTHWIPLGGADTSRTLALPGPPDVDRATAELNRRPLGGRPFDDVLQGVRLALGPRLLREAPAQPGLQRTSVSARSGGRLPGMLAVVAAMAVAVLLLAGGAASSSFNSPWNLLFLLPGAVLSWPVGCWLTGNESRPALFRLGAGTVVTAGTSLVGFFWWRASPGSGFGTVLGVAVAGCAVLLLIGVWHALRDSWLSRNANWLAPVLVTPLAFFLPVAGRLLHTVYLTEVFGIPADTVPIAFYWQYLVALKPMGIVLLVVLFLVGLAGWARYFHWASGIRELTWIIWPLILIVYVLTAFQVGIVDATGAARSAASAARQGKNPNGWFGIQGNLMCLRPVGEKVPVINGPVPTEEPVLFFGTSGDHLWVWAPQRNRESPGRQWNSLRIRAESVTVQAPRAGRKGPVCRKPHE